MRLTRYADLEWSRRATAVSVGAPDGAANRPRPASQIKVLARGEPGLPGYFEMVVSRYPEAKEYKRHRHIVDQIRYTLAGSSPWAPDRATEEGGLLYVPAHTYYGPYVRPAGVELMAVQFAAGRDQPFEENSVPPERDTGRPPTRFTVPIELRPDAFPWRAAGTGVRTKEIIRVGTDGTALSMVGVADGGRHRLVAGQRTLGFVLGGAGAVGGRPVAERDGLYFDSGEEAEVSSDLELQLLLIALPT
jgi:hypothetical protein